MLAFELLFLVLQVIHVFQLSYLSTQGAGTEAQWANVTAGEIVEALESLYTAGLAQSGAVEQLITVLTHHISASLPGLTAGMPTDWNGQLFTLQLYQRLLHFSPALFLF